jgi:hypothetical protein
MVHRDSHAPMRKKGIGAQNGLHFKDFREEEKRNWEPQNGQ